MFIPARSSGRSRGRASGPRAASPKAGGDESVAPVEPRPLIERYEALRAAALDAAADGFRHGLALLLGKGVVAWMAVAAHAAPERADRESAGAPESGALEGLERELVRVLAGIALQAVQG
jgi:hypothetical protein